MRSLEECANKFANQLEFPFMQPETKFEFTSEQVRPAGLVMERSISFCSDKLPEILNHFEQFLRAHGILRGNGTLQFVPSVAEPAPRRSILNDVERNFGHDECSTPT